jgi:hypothetical protein
MVKAVFHLTLGLTAVFIGMRVGNDLLRSIGTPPK